MSKKCAYGVLNIVVSSFQLQNVEFLLFNNLMCVQRSYLLFWIEFLVNLFVGEFDFSFKYYARIDNADDFICGMLAFAIFVSLFVHRKSNTKNENVDSWVLRCAMLSQQLLLWMDNAMLLWKLAQEKISCNQKNSQITKIKKKMVK